MSRMPPAAIVVLLAGGVLTACPLTIDVRCVTDLDCEANEFCAVGVCRTGVRDADSGPDDGGTSLLDGGADGGADAGADGGQPDAAFGEDAGRDAGFDGGLGDGGEVIDAGTDAGCVADRADGQTCTAACQCSAAGAACSGGVCGPTCLSDFECQDDRRCEAGACLAGSRLGEACTSGFQCYEGHCNLTWQRCEAFCATAAACSTGYRCAEDGFCVPACEQRPPPRLGLSCKNSYDCPCGDCVRDDQNVLRCHQRCMFDEDCASGDPGSCEQKFTSYFCRL